MLLYHLLSSLYVECGTAAMRVYFLAYWSLSFQHASPERAQRLVRAIAKERGWMLFYLFLKQKRLEKLCALVFCSYKCAAGEPAGAQHISLL